MQVLAPTQLFNGEEIIEGVTVSVDGGRIVDVSTAPSASSVRLDGLLAPGFIDIQVNGGGGVLFNDAPNVETLATIAAAHRTFGVTGFLATLISDDRAKVAAAIDAVARAIDVGAAGLLGLHLEGPWLSDPRRGVHPAKFLRRFDDADLTLIAQKRPFPVLVTVAPEQIDADNLKKLVAAGVTVSLGHTGANAEDVEAALAAGATGFTHLFNAMPPLEGRRPGALGAALGNRRELGGDHTGRNSRSSGFGTGCFCCEDGPEVDACFGRDGDDRVGQAFHVAVRGRHLGHRRSASDRFRHAGWRASRYGFGDAECGWPAGRFDCARRCGWRA